MHKTRKPLFPNWKEQKKTNYFSKFFLLWEKSHSAENGTLRSQNAFLKPKTFWEVKGYTWVHFDQKLKSRTMPKNSVRLSQLLRKLIAEI